MQRILIVDDEPKVCECLNEFFEAKGFESRCALTGEDAILQLMAGHPDVILLDIKLPGISGLDVLKRAKDLCPSSKVIMVTAMSDENSEETARAYGASGYIMKPFDFSPNTWATIFDDPAGPRTHNPTPKS